MQGSLFSFFNKSAAKGAAAASSSPGSSKKRSIAQAGLSNAATPYKAIKLNKGSVVSPVKASASPKKSTVAEEVKSAAAADVVVNDDVEEEKKAPHTGR